VTLSPDLLLHAYAIGAFPMADPDAGGQIGWYAPDPRGVIPLDGFRVPRSLRRVVRQGRFEVRTDTAFEAVVRACAAPARGRETTWISSDIVAAYTALHARGAAHSVECWRGGALVGGLYGVALGGAFFGESMFHRETDASKVALVHLVDRLRAGGFALLDTQWTTDHLARFGAVEIPREVYERRLARALRLPARWRALDEQAS
jgi:leucyl/phenylalanyl-tRNA--protein transferase